jgi:CHASE1-domain containing sensor protein
MKNKLTVTFLSLACLLTLTLKANAQSNSPQSNEARFASLKTEGTTIKTEQIDDIEHGSLIRETRSLLISSGETSCEQTIDAQSKKVLLTICQEISNPDYIDDIQKR